HEECLEVVHVIGWSWLGLPPLRPVVPAEDTRRRSWLAYNPHRDRSSAAKRPWWQRVFGD
ncbi:MAG TPA: hypothetical protein VKE74_36445, partial [Gemmataceae bacterium]|nr:hypothetical protein [Gemmataceae bacterium]